MKNSVRYVVATVAGMIVAGCLVMLIEICSTLRYPIPEGVDFNDQAAMAKFVSGLPTGAFVFVLAAWSAGAVGGAATGRLLAPGRDIRPALVIVVLLLVATLVNLIQIPHPAWMWPAGLAVFPFFGGLGMWLTAPRTAESPGLQ